MIRKKNKFAWPKKLYDKQRILDENKLVLKYGLKNKREIWKAEAKVNHFRKRAKELITAEQKEQELFFAKLNKMGLNVKTIADVLALNKENILERRLPSILVKKKIANTPKQARQLVVHKRVLIGNETVNIPSYIVKTNEENLISLKKFVKKAAPVQKMPDSEDEPEKIQQEGEIAQNA